jgi:hypothetical protein
MFSTTTFYKWKDFFDILWRNGRVYQSQRLRGLAICGIFVFENAFSLLLKEELFESIWVLEA